MWRHSFIYSCAWFTKQQKLFYIKNAASKTNQMREKNTTTEFDSEGFGGIFKSVIYLGCLHLTINIFDFLFLVL